MFVSGHTLRFYERFNRNDAEADRSRGKEDGACGQPPSGSQDFSGYQLSAINTTESDISSYLVELDEQVSALDAAKTDRQLRKDAYSGVSSGLRTEFENAVTQLKDSVGPGSAVYDRARIAVSEIEKQLSSIRAGVSERPLQVDSVEKPAGWGGVSWPDE